MFCAIFYLWSSEKLGVTLSPAPVATEYCLHINTFLTNIFCCINFNNIIWWAGAKILLVELSL